VLGWRTEPPVDPNGVPRSKKSPRPSNSSPGLTVLATFTRIDTARRAPQSRRATHSPPCLFPLDAREPLLTNNALRTIEFKTPSLSHSPE
jgi:hypothetical protein